jgi:transcriptional regulator with XRE-family HTH domain
MDRQFAKSLGAAARRARKTLELTQEDAAERIGVSVEFYARIERGHSLPSMSTFVRITRALGVSADALIGRLGAGDGEPLWLPRPMPIDNPEVRRVSRLLRKASPATLRAVGVLMREMEQAVIRNARAARKAAESEEAGAAEADSEAEKPEADNEVPDEADSEADNPEDSGPESEP